MVRTRQEEFGPKIHDPMIGVIELHCILENLTSKKSNWIEDKLLG